VEFGANQDFTLSLWVKHNEPTATNFFPTVLSKEPGGGTRVGYNIGLHNQHTDARWYFQIYVNNTSYQVFGRNNVSDNKWHHLVGIRPGSVIATYEDGVVANQASGNSGDTTNSVNLNIGQLTNAGSCCLYNGLIDDVRIYNRALSADEIKRLYNMGR
jgi:hypothetical protein